MSCTHSGIVRTRSKNMVLECTLAVKGHEFRGFFDAVSRVCLLGGVSVW